MNDDQFAEREKRGPNFFHKIKVKGEEVKLFRGENSHDVVKNSIYTKSEDGKVAEFKGAGGLIGFEYKPYYHYYTTYKGTEAVGNRGKLLITFNDKVVYGVWVEDELYAMVKCAEIIHKIKNFVFDLSNAESWLVGRKIYYKDTPSLITEFIGEEGKIVIKSLDEYSFPVPTRVIREEIWEGYPVKKESKILQVDIFSENIYWGSFCEKEGK